MNNQFDKIAPGIPAKIGLLLDALILVVSLIFVSGGLNVVFDAGFFAIVLTAMGTWFFCAATLRHYSPCTPRRTGDSLVLGVLGVVGVTIAATVAHSLTTTANPFDPLLFTALFYLGVVAFQMLLVKPLMKKFRPGPDPVLIVGAGSIGSVTHRILTQKGQRDVIGFLRYPDEPDAVTDCQAPVLGEASDLYKVLCRHPVNEVYIAERVMEKGDRMQSAVRVCEEVGVPFAVPLHSLRYDRASLLSSSPARDGYLHYLNTRAKPLQYAIKRMIDIAVSATALFLLSPLLVAVAMAIKLTSPGPIIFRQKRVGLHGANFHLLKFRSMVDDAEKLKGKLAAKNEQDGPVFKMKNDPRVTAVGRFIRKYSIDELPQIVNILRGDMTIVGPRPALPKEVAQYELWQRRRLSARPGLTCYWQVGGRNEIGFDEWMLLDLRYVDNWSLSVDTKLILKTFPVVLAGRGAS